MSFWKLPAREIAALVADRRASAREVAADALARLEAANPALNAVVDHRPDEVLAQADALDARLARGEAPGPLCGVPVTTKINTDQRGFATTHGLTANRDLIATHDSPVVENLRKAGAILLGRTNTPALSARWFTDNQLHGRTRNPRDTALTPGGSSGGAGAAIATGIGAIAHGTDIAGSIRYPAYACGVHGLRPTLGRVPSFNATGPERTIGAQLTAVSGPLARTIADLRLALAAMAAPSPIDPWHVPAPLEGPKAARRVIVCVAPDGLASTPEVADAVRDAGRRLAAGGWSVEEVDNLPPLAEAAELATKLWFGEAYAAMRPAAEADGDPGLLAVLDYKAALVDTLDEKFAATILQRRATLLRAWSLFFETYAVAVLPISAEPPFPDDLDRRNRASRDRIFAAQMTMIGLPLLGLPALAVATGLDARGVPRGVQVVAARFREDLCLEAGATIEAAGTPPMPIEPGVERRAN